MLVLEVAGRGWHRRCATYCHERRRPTCDCCCSGVFHGAVARPGGIQAALREHGLALLDLWLAAEARGDAVLLFARVDLQTHSIISRRGKSRRAYQLPLVG